MANRAKPKKTAPIRRAPKTRKSIGLEPPKPVDTEEIAQRTADILLPFLLKPRPERRNMPDTAFDEGRPETGPIEQLRVGATASVVNGQPEDPLVDRIGNRNTVLFNRLTGTRDHLESIASRMLGGEPPTGPAAASAQASMTGAVGSLYDQQQQLFDLIDQIDHHARRLSRI